MKTTLLLTLLILLIGGTASAQDWQTVRLDDTVYFTAGTHSGGTNETGKTSPDSGMLRAIYIARVQDSLFHFPTGIRDTSDQRRERQSGCLDTLAPSWLGKVMIRRSGGVENYVNSSGDTIEFRTKARVGDGWTILTDNTGTEFRAVVTGAAASVIDNAADSVKTLRIATFRSGKAVANYYNGMMLRWSKDHGWITTLDLYQFPSNRSFWDYGGTGFDSTLHERIPAAISKRNLYETDLQWVCQPGNEWITNSKSAGSLSPSPAYIGYMQQILTHDSIISVSSLTADFAIVLLKRSVFELKEPYPSGSGFIRQASISSAIILDTIRRSPTVAMRLPQLVLPGNKDDMMDYRAFCKPFCDDHYVLSRHKVRIRGLIDRRDSCTSVQPRIDGVIANSSMYLSGFGGLGGISYSGEGWYDGYLSSFSYDFLKLGNCVFGKKYDVIQLSAAGPAMNEDAVSLAPNPADKQVRLRSGNRFQKARIRIIDVLGKTIRELEPDGAEHLIETSGMTPGVYFMQVSGQNIQQTLRFVVQH